MAVMKVYSEGNSEKYLEYKGTSACADVLKSIGVALEQWWPEQELNDEASQEEILAAFDKPLSKLMKQRGFKTADVMALSPHHPQKKELRQKFLSEHTHDDDEARYFIKGQGLFYIHAQSKVYAVLCEKGDLINVPKGTRHWFDMGPEPSFQCIRAYTNEQGWVAKGTGSDIGESFPRLGE